jgi:hypothetical protein
MKDREEKEKTIWEMRIIVGGGVREEDACEREK